MSSKLKIINSLLFYFTFILLLNILPITHANKRIKESSLTPVIFTQSNLKLNSKITQAPGTTNVGNTVSPHIINHNNNTNNLIIAHRIIKYQVTAFCLSLFLPFGSAHFYIGRWWLGLIKLCFMLLTPIVIAILVYCAKCCVGEGGKCCGINPVGIFICWGVFAGIYWLVDMILFGKNVYVDYYGYPLVAW